MMPSLPYKNFLFALLCGLYVSLAGPHCLATLTRQEQEAMIQKCKPPAIIKEKLDHFFNDPNVVSFYLQREKVTLMHRASPETKAKNAAIVLSSLASGIEKQADQIKEKHNIEWKRHFDLPKTNPVHCYALLMKQYKIFYFKDLPQFIIKIPMKQWPLVYQNVSRAFYNEKIHDTVNELGLKHVMLFKKYLYHIPGRPNELTDKNYIIIAQHIRSLPSVQENRTLFKKMLVEEDGLMCAHPDYEDLLVEMIQLINSCGLWDIKDHNVFIVDDQVAYVDIEQPGLGGSNDEDFFHKNPSQVKANAACGFDYLCKLLNDEES